MQLLVRLKSADLEIQLSTDLRYVAGIGEGAESADALTSLGQHLCDGSECHNECSHVAC